MAMKNWKKLISGVVAMMTVAAAVSAAPAKLPVEVLDVADATGVTYSGYPVVVVKDGEEIETSYGYAEHKHTAADNGGEWIVSTGNTKGPVGDVKETENGVKLTHTSTKRNAELSAGYTTDSLYTYADTKVQFSYMVSDVREKNSQLIQVSSGTIAAGQPSFTGVADCGGMAGLFKYHNNSAIVQVSAEGIKYLDVKSGELKKVDVDLKAGTVYSFRFENVAGEGTYDLYIDEDKIGVNSVPVAEDIELFNPTGEALNTVRVWLESGLVDDNKETTEVDEQEANRFSATITDIRFMESKPATIVETFDNLPATGSIGTTVALNESFDYADLAEMEAAGWSVTFPEAITTATAEITGGKFKSHMTKKIKGSTAHTITAERSLDGDEKGILTLTAGLGLDETGSVYTNSNAMITFIDEAGNSLAAISIQSGYPLANTQSAFVLSVGDKSQKITCADYKALGGRTTEDDSAYVGTIYDGTIYNIKLVSDKNNNTVKLYAEGVEEPIITIDGACISGAKKISLIHNQHGYRNAARLTNSSAYFDYVKLAYSGEGWDHRNSDSNIGSVTAPGALTINYNTGKERGGGLYSRYTATELLGEECFELSYDFIPTLTAGKLWASFTLAGNGANSDAVVTGGPINTVTKVPAYSDSIQIAVINDAFTYGCSDSTGNYYKAIPKELVKYESGKKYYLKIKVDAAAGTYTMWLSDEEITSETTPVAENESFFLPSGTAPSSWLLAYNLQRLVSGNDAGTIVVDNLVFKRNSPTDFAVMNDDQQYMTSLGTSAYIDLINVPTDKEVIVAYYDADNKLVDVAVATADALRAKKTDETAVSALVMTWDDFNNIVPVDAAIELK